MQSHYRGTGLGQSSALGCWVMGGILILDGVVSNDVVDVFGLGERASRGVDRDDDCLGVEETGATQADGNIVSPA